MRLLLRDTDPTRIIALGFVTLVAGANIAVPLFLGNELRFWLDRLVLSEVASDILLFSIGYIFAPAFIGYRVATAPQKSGVFPIALLTCGAVGLLLYAYIVPCSSSPQCNLYLALNIVAFWIGAFFCTFPKWSVEP